jgi:thiamine biosynthesis lipoprotein
MPRILIPATLPSGLPGAVAAPVALDRLGGETMGTTWSVVLPRGASGVLERALRGELDRITAEMSHWEPASALGRFNDAPAGTWHALPIGFFGVLEYALAVAEAGDGAYDPTAGRLVDAWGFGPRPRPPTPPDGDEIAAALADVGWRRLTLDRAGRRAFQPGGLRLDLSSVAKGHAVDRVGALLRRFGVDDALVEIGGELLGLGTKPDGTPWWVALEDVPGLAEPGQGTLVALCGLAIATSGDYRRFFESGGARYAHSLDPRTGRPAANRLASVTVLHPHCMQADALSTLLTVLGPVDGMAYAARNRLAVRFVERTDAGGGIEHLSPALRAMLD